MSAMSWGTAAVLLPRRRWRRTRVHLLLAVAVTIILGSLSGNAVAEKSKKSVGTHRVTPRALRNPHARIVRARKTAQFVLVNIPRDPFPGTNGVSLSEPLRARVVRFLDTCERYLYA
ncbi:hypothetical protein DMN91_006248 [Ooceraea biroi]|uniref:Uncharacterized protein n=1 Tax=Ooceraea biroi TaxID=2015173 RepID=A0A3L8DNB2_OOCBI|nr:hypothetical protein DMN91_006248 [Ooceraea biroi]